MLPETIVMSPEMPSKVTRILSREVQRESKLFLLNKRGVFFNVSDSLNHHEMKQEE